MKVAFLASEVIPYAKTGGLADVAGALPKFLAGLGAEVRVFMPLYREVRKKDLALEPVIAGASLPAGGAEGTYGVLAHRGDGFTVHFIDRPGYFDREALYGTPAGDYPDNGERFAFFCRASLEAMKATGFVPDVIHGHDWQSALTFAYLRTAYADDPWFGRTRTLFTIHNLAYQGLFEKDLLGRIGLPESLFSMDGLEFYGRVNALKAGILYATAVTTVSPRYSREIQTPEFGCGLDGLLRSRAGALHGILNGVDYKDWDPATDRLIPRNFTPADLAGKAACRQALAGEFGLTAPADRPIAGMVTRLAGQKGLDIVCRALDDLLGLGLVPVILGTGDQEIQDFLLSAREKNPGRIGLRIAFDERLARTIYAASDIFLIPSRYEPCGLTQMYAMKYGTVPVVRATGGLDDSVQEYDARTGRGNGFKFVEAEAGPLTEAARRALASFRKPDEWRKLVGNAMAADFSWNRSAADYLALYKKIASD
ncbi:MAG TPA: glycogen synthase GlgA [Candidatus Aminicenantes bacterium]|nr:glycogen synthase GlgA [Candidatus Aminicenantes bacterium]HRY65189.1 glycogen synthase GlgA [Candidatus Aminicenantes bacterium]HRZ72343.1 glycogen synthase GlgA [Candidatus Aminicenantes bacterium]